MERIKLWLKENAWLTAYVISACGIGMVVLQLYIHFETLGRIAFWVLFTLLIWAFIYVASLWVRGFVEKQLETLKLLPSRIDEIQAELRKVPKGPSESVLTSISKHEKGVRILGERIEEITKILAKHKSKLTDTTSDIGQQDEALEKLFERLQEIETIIQISGLKAIPDKLVTTQTKLGLLTRRIDEADSWIETFREEGAGGIKANLERYYGWLENMVFSINEVRKIQGLALLNLSRESPVITKTPRKQGDDA